MMFGSNINKISNSIGNKGKRSIKLALKKIQFKEQGSAGGLKMDDE